MAKFTVNIKKCAQSWNDKNPTLRKKTSSSIAEEIGITKQGLSQISKLINNDKLKAHLGVIFLVKDKAKIKQNWEKYLELNNITLNHLENVRKSLECEIWDLISKEAE